MQNEAPPMPDVRGKIPRPPEVARAAFSDWADEQILAQQRRNIARKLANPVSPSADWPRAGGVTASPLLTAEQRALLTRGGAL